MNCYAVAVVLFSIVTLCQGAYPNGPSTEGTVSAVSLLAWVKTHETTANLTNANAFCNQATGAGTVCSTKTVNVYQVGGKISTTQPIFWQSNMDVDCDGSTSPLCSNDPSHQNGLSYSSVDAAVTPFYVVPGCSLCNACSPGGFGPFAYNKRGIAYGQVAAIVYQIGANVGVAYAPFLDEDGCNQEIGEGSYALNYFLGINPDPLSGGSADNNVAYIVFPGSANRVTDFSHTAAANARIISIGEKAAMALLASASNAVSAVNISAVEYHIDRQTIDINSNGSHFVSVFGLNGESVMAANGMGPKVYNTAHLGRGIYIVKVATKNGLFTHKIITY
jgi:hypothetical protein